MEWGPESIPTIIAFIGLFGLWFGVPGFLLWPIFALIPPIAFALVLRSRGKVSLSYSGGTKKHKRPAVGAGMFICAIGLAGTAYFQFDTLIWDQALAINVGAACVAGVLWALVASRIDPQDASDGLMVVFGVIGGALWTLGLLVELNGAFPSRYVSFRVADVVEQEVVTRRKSPDIQRLWLKPRDGAEPLKMDVTRRFYDGVRTGERLCLLRIKGQMRMSWRDVSHCPAALDPVTIGE
jgi:hypothetical protein